MTKKFKPIHKHLLIKAIVKEPIKDPLAANFLLVNLVTYIGMVPVTTPQSVYVDTPGNEGLTGSVNLATSHVAYHMWDETGVLMMDVYSCCDFETIKVVEFIGKAFGGYKFYEVVVVDREGFREIERLKFQEV